MQEVGQSCWALCIQALVLLASQQTQEVGDVLQQTFREGKEPVPGHRAVGSELGFSLRSTNSQAHALSCKAVPRLSATGDKERAEEVPAR